MKRNEYFTTINDLVFFFFSKFPNHGYHEHIKKILYIIVNNETGPSIL
jgi:hypothetical protein